MTRELIEPNLHVALVHFPIGLLALGVLIEMLSFLWRGSSLQSAGRWMIGLGAMLGIPVCFSGIYAMADVARALAPADVQYGTWAEIRAGTTLSSDAWETLRWHLWMECGAIALAAIVVMVFVASTDATRHRLRAPLLVVLLASVGLMLAGAWHGGEVVYRSDTVARMAAEPATIPADWGGRIVAIAPPRQVHVLLAGLAIAMTLSSLAACLRRANTVGVAAAGLSAARPPAARLAVVAFVLAVMTSAAGWWILIHEAGTWNPGDIWTMVASAETRRRLFHVILGVGMMLVPLVLAGAMWLTTPRRGWLLVLAAAHVAVAAAQVWLGVLLLFDGVTGSAWAWN